MTTDLRQRIADALARHYDGQPLPDLRDEHAAHHAEAADAVLAVLPPPADEVDADTVANRAAQVITTMGAEIRELKRSRDRYQSVWHNARRRAAVLSAELTRRAPLLGEYAAELDRLRRLADEAQQQEPESGCAHCGGDHSWDDCQTYTAVVADEAQQQREPSVHGESVAALAGYQPDGHDTWDGEQQPRPAKASAAVDEWRGATELVPDHEVRRLSATGVVGYRQDQGRLLHCLHHKPVPASRWADFHEVTSDDLPDGGICVHPRCGADLLAVQPAVDARQDGAQQ